jgi:hypothetical protein
MQAGSLLVGLFLLAIPFVSHLLLSAVDWTTALPVLGPLLAKPHIEWWFLAVVLLFGVPAKETEYETEIDETGRAVIDTNGRPIRRAVQRWRSRGLVAAIWVGVTGHARLADRVGALELGVETLKDGLTAVVAEIRALRDALERTGIARPVSRADGGSILPPPIADELPAQSRRPMPSRPQ